MSERRIVRQLRSRPGQRRRRLKLNLTEGQRLEIQTKAMSVGMSMSRYIVDTWRQAPKTGKQLARIAAIEEVLERHFPQLREIGIKINEVARQANTTHQQPANTQDVLDEMSQILRKISEEVREARTREY